MAAALGASRGARACRSVRAGTASTAPGRAPRVGRRAAAARPAAVAEPAAGAAPGEGGEGQVDQDVRNFALALAEAADDAKAVNIAVRHVGPTVYWTEYFLIATVFSKPQLDAVAFRMREVATRFFDTPPGDGVEPGTWTVIDLGDVVVHLMTPEQREHYNLEEKYEECPLVDLPFETTTWEAPPRLY